MSFLVINAVVAIVVGVAILLTVRRKMGTGRVVAVMALTGILALMGLITFRTDVPGVLPRWALIPTLLYITIVVMFLATLLLLLIWQFFVWLRKANSTGAAVNPDERKRILGMVAQGN